MGRRDGGPAPSLPNLPSLPSKDLWPMFDLLDPPKFRPTKYPHILSVSERIRRLEEGRCWECAEEFTAPGRRGHYYCSEACRLSNYRRRRIAAGAHPRCAFEDSGECFEPEDAAWDLNLRQYVCIQHEFGEIEDEEEAPLEPPELRYCFGCAGVIRVEARADAKYCTAACRQRAYRRRVRMADTSRDLYDAKTRGPLRPGTGLPTPDVLDTRERFDGKADALAYCERFDLPATFVYSETYRGTTVYLVPTAADDPDRPRLSDRPYLLEEPA